MAKPKKTSLENRNLWCHQDQIFSSGLLSIRRFTEKSVRGLSGSAACMLAAAYPPAATLWPKKSLLFQDLAGCLHATKIRRGGASGNGDITPCRTTSNLSDTSGFAMQICYAKWGSRPDYDGIGWGGIRTPGAFRAHTLSRRAQSTTLSPIQNTLPLPLHLK